jgi:hypothetical protein
MVYIEGGFTIVIGALLYWIIVDCPDIATYLTRQEKEILKGGLKADGQHGARTKNFTSELASEDGRLTPVL